jgi:hypothetical protein
MKHKKKVKACFGERHAHYKYFNSLKMEAEKASKTSDYFSILTWLAAREGFRALNIKFLFSKFVFFLTNGTCVRNWLREF